MYSVSSGLITIFLLSLLLFPGVIPDSLGGYGDCSGCHHGRVMGLSTENRLPCILYLL